MEPGKDDIIVLLGDVGANFFGGMRDETVKAMLDMCGPKLLCVHGNHEMRPWNVPGYELKEWHGGKVWVQESFPNLLFAKDGEIFDLDGLRCIVIGGAYSVDKPMRLSRGYGWWEDEQPSDEIKTYVEEQLRTNPIDVVLSHTCPFKYEPVEMFLSGVDQSGVDDSTERWLDKIEESIDYKDWFCGHWHTDKRIDRMHFLFESFEGLERE
jgi:3-oxoacid CoA-transferase subunit A